VFLENTRVKKELSKTSHVTFIMTTHPHLVQRLRMSGGIPALHPYTLMECTRTILLKFLIGFIFEWGRNLTLNIDVRYCQTFFISPQTGQINLLYSLTPTATPCAPQPSFQTQNLVCIIRFSLCCKLSNTIFTGFEGELSDYRRILHRDQQLLILVSDDVIWEMRLILQILSKTLSCFSHSFL
jgi:hypothetical protein